MSAADMAGVAVDRLAEELARDVGILRRRFASNGAWTGAYIADRLADNLESLHLSIHPSAAELAAAAHPGDDGAVAAAIAQVDRRVLAFRHQLGRT